MSWILSKEGQRYLKNVDIAEKVIIEELSLFREELTDGQIKLIANTAARKIIQAILAEKDHA